jgi:hypothetical protein
MNVELCVPAMYVYVLTTQFPSSLQLSTTPQHTHTHTQVIIRNELPYNSTIYMSMESYHNGKTAIIRERTDVCSYSNLGFVGNDGVYYQLSEGNVCPLRADVHYLLLTSFTVQDMSQRGREFTPDLVVVFYANEDEYSVPVGCAETGTLAQIALNEKRSDRGVIALILSITCFAMTFGICLYVYRRRERAADAIENNRIASMIRRYQYRRTNRSGAVSLSPSLPNVDSFDNSSGTRGGSARSGSTRTDDRRRYDRPYSMPPPMRYQHPWPQQESHYHHNHHHHQQHHNHQLPVRPPTQKVFDRPPYIRHGECQPFPHDQYIEEDIEPDEHDLHVDNNSPFHSQNDDAGHPIIPANDANDDSIKQKSIFMNTAVVADHSDPPPQPPPPHAIATDHVEVDETSSCLDNSPGNDDQSTLSSFPNSQLDDRPEFT